MNRRAALTTIGSGLCASLSGCSAVDAVIRGCRDGKDRVEYDGPVHGNTWGGFKLTARPDEVDIGNRITFKLINISDEPQDTSTKPRYLIERREENTWKSIYWAPSGNAEYLLIQRTHDFGEGWAWTFTTTQSGFEPENPPGPDTTPDYDVCTEITPGTYRFVYSGLLGDDAMTVQFTIDA